MKSAQAVSFLLEQAYDDASLQVEVRKLSKQLGAPATMAYVFISSDYLPHWQEIQDTVRVDGRCPLVIGCTGWGIIGTGREAERASGISILMLSLPETEIKPYVIRPKDVEDINEPQDWHAQLDLLPQHVDSFMILGTPTSPYVDQMVKQWNKAYAGVTCVGGLATTTQTAEENAVFWNDRIINEGCIVLAFRGRIKVRGLVSQGCRPIGEPLTITRVDKNVIFTLGAKSAYDVLYGAFEKLSKDEKEHAYGNLFVGLATSEYVDNHKRGQFLIRNIMGADPDTGAVAIASYPRLGQTFQYQLRDKETAHEDLEQILEKEAHRKQKAFATMLFACNGRGSTLFETDNHDAQLLEEKFGKLPTAGFFCAGEVGPIGKENFIHGYTASMAFFLDGKE